MCDHVIGMAKGSGESWLVYESKREKETEFIVSWFVYCPSCGMRLFKSFGPNNKFAWNINEGRLKCQQNS